VRLFREVRAFDRARMRAARSSTAVTWNVAAWGTQPRPKKIATAQARDDKYDRCGLITVWVWC
jgi:hypothetical protein